MHSSVFWTIIFNFIIFIGHRYFSALDVIHRFNRTNVLSTYRRYDNNTSSMKHNILFLFSCLKSIELCNILFIWLRKTSKLSIEITQTTSMHMNNNYVYNTYVFFFLMNESNSVICYYNRRRPIINVGIRFDKWVSHFIWKSAIRRSTFKIE